MQKILKKLSSLLLSATVLCSVYGAVLSVSAATIDEATAAATDKIYVSAEEINSKGAKEAVQAALDTARDNAKAEKRYRVTVAPGEYELDDCLYIFSNTILSLKDVTFKRVGRINLLRTGEPVINSENPEEVIVDKGVTGYDAYVNITVEGGTFDGAGGNNTIFKAGHATNVSLLGTTFQNERNGHIMEIAGVDGFYVNGCHFIDQLLEGTTGYEAIQFDIFKKYHIYGFRSEDLNMRNIVIENCVFKNCPRGIGNHTSVFNNPFDGITIRNNEFYDINSCAIQGTNWINCDISNNYMENVARAVAVYSLCDGMGAYYSDTIAEEGGTASRYSRTYQHKKHNIKITDNIIKGCGDIEDNNADYVTNAIAVIGCNIVEPSVWSDGSGNMPQGTYPLDGVVVSNNQVETRGYGIRAEYVKNGEFAGNSISCEPNRSNQAKRANGKYHGILARATTAGKIVNNTIKNPVFDGIHIDYESVIEAVTDNEIYNSGNNGIFIHGSTAGSVNSNRIDITKNCGISVTHGSTPPTRGSIVNNGVRYNVISNVVYGIHVSAKSSAGSLNSNTITRCSKKDIAYSKSSGINLGSNYSSTAAIKILSLDKSAIELTEGSVYKLLKSVSPSNASGTVSWITSNYSVASVDDTGLIIARSAGTAVITAQASSGASATCTVRVSSRDVVQVIGDINADGEVNLLDRIYLTRSLANWKNYQTLNVDISDFNEDGAVNLLDRVIFTRYLAGWEKYTNLPYIPLT